MAITDQKLTSVPSATRGRMQLTNPVQVMNAGRNTKLDPQKAMSDINATKNTERYNPIMAKENGVSPLKAPYTSPTPSTFGISAVTPATSAKPAGVDNTFETGNETKFGYPTGINASSGEQLYSTTFGDTRVQATPSYIEMLDKYFRDAPYEDKIKFLQNVANGIYEQNNIPTTATMTGDNEITNYPRR